MGPKKKLTKAEKERLKREEAEKKVQEEEEARRQAEEDERERKKREKVEAEERKQVEKQERHERGEQLTELRGVTGEMEVTRTNFHGNRRKEAKWARYMRCDGSPDPAIAGEINTYMNLWRENRQGEDIHSVLKESVLTLSLIDELDFLLSDTPAEELPAAEAERYRGTIQDLQRLLAYKLDQASFELLLRASDLADSETMNLQQVIGNDVIRLCVWGNLSKNPRIKQHEFAEVGFTFDIPKMLGLSDVSIRVLISKFDHLSFKTASFRPRVKPKEIEPEEEVAPEKAEEEEQKDEDEEKQDGEEGEKEEDDGGDLMAQLAALEHQEEEGEQEKEEEKKEEEEELVDIPEDGRISPEALDYEDFEGEDDWVDLRSNEVLGGVMYFNLMPMPPQPKSIKKWNMRALPTPDEFTTLEYVADSVKVGGNPGSDAGTVKSDNTEKKDERPPIGITLKLPGDVYFSEEPQIARWDDKYSVWRMDGFTETNYNEDDRIITFKTAHFGAIALLQDVHINMPFQSWEVRPRGVNHVVITIIAAIVEVELEVKDDKVCLTQPDDCKELEHFRGKWLPLLDFIKTMKAAGLNIFPNEDSPKYVAVQKKTPVGEDMFYQQAALVGSALAFSWSKWNAEQPRDRVVVQATQCIEDEPILEEDWQLLTFMRKRVNRLKMTEFDETWSDEVHPDSKFQADLWHLAQQVCGEEGKARVAQTSWQFVDTLYHLMAAVKFMTYS